MTRTSARIAGLLLVLSPLGSPLFAACPLLPTDNVWNAPITHLPVDARSAAYVASIGATTGLHPDFGSGTWNGAPIGIPYLFVPGTQPRVPVSFGYADESDPGPYPIPADAPIEGGPNGNGDRHVLVVDDSACKLYELFDAHPRADGSWRAGSGAVYALGSNVLRPASWTSADAAGLPILPGLATCADLARGEIKHALRFTASRTQRKYVWPARHYASTITDANVPPMGQRFRLKSSFNTAPYSPQTRIILDALKTYGMLLADNGSNWFISGAPGDCWDDDRLVNELRAVKGADFEAVDSSSMMLHVDSGQVRSTAPVNYTLTARTTGGAGTITSEPAGITCGTQCAGSYPAGTVVALTATPGNGQQLVGWSGCTSVAGARCTVNMAADATATATFMPAASYVLHVTKSGRGTVVSTPTGIHCGPRATCAANDARFPAGTQVALAATPDVGYVFKVWEGACSGTGACVVAMSADRSVIARFRARRPSDP